MKWIMTIVGAYAAIAGGVFMLHVIFLQMVTPGLALARAAVWPYFIATGRPHGTPLPMD